MTDGMIILFVSFVVGMITIITPIIRLNGTITKLDTTIENLKREFEKGQKSLESRVDMHGKQVDELEKTAVNHEVRIVNLEGKEKRNGN